MKKSLFLLGLLSLAALASCKQEDLMQPEQSPRFYGVLEQPVSDVATRVHMDETNHFFWNFGDLLSIFYGKTYNRQYRYTGDNHTTAGGFERSDEDPSHATEQTIDTGFDYAIFPWNQQNGCDTQGNLDVVIPSVQEYYDDSFGVGLRPLLVARAPKDDGMFYFKHIGSYIAIKMKGDGVSVKSISFQGNDSETMAGKLYVSFGTDGLPIVNGFNSTSAFVPLSKTISMTFDTPIELNMDTEKVVWLVVPPGDFSGYTLTINDSEGGTFERVRTEALTFVRATFYEIVTTVTITPAAVPVSGVTVTPATLELTVGGQSTLTATVSPENATNKKVSWESSDETVATVDEDGVVTAVAAGTATITVTTDDGDQTATCAVTVNNYTYEIALTADKDEINVGEELIYSVILTTFKNGTKESEVPVEGAILTCDDEYVTLVNGYTVKGKKQGPGVISATYAPDGATEPVTATAQLTINDVVTYTLEIDPAEDAEVNAGSEITFKLWLTTTTNGNAERMNVAADATWTINEEFADIASIVSPGTVKGLKEGTATITAKYTTPDGIETSTAQLTVNKKPDQPGPDVPIGGGGSF